MYQKDHHGTLHEPNTKIHLMDDLVGDFNLRVRLFRLHGFSSIILTLPGRLIAAEVVSLSGRIQRQGWNAGHL